MIAFQHVATSVTTVAAATLLLAACGGGSSTEETSAPAAPSSATTAQAENRAEMCGQTRGPDGALYVHTLGETKVDCAEAMKVAEAFGPKIAMAQPVTVEGWDCTFPKTPGMLARCDSGDKAIGFFLTH